MKNLLINHFSPSRLTMCSDNVFCRQDCGEDWCFHALLVGMSIGTTFLELNLGELIKLHMDLPFNKGTSPPGVYSKDTSPTNTGKSLSIQVKCPSAEEG